MIIKKAEFIKSAADQSGFLAGDLPEFAMCGRSNVGKSSFINMLTGNGRLAKTSKDPGRTRLVNYFSINGGQFVLVDLPGYGYARVSEVEKQKWGRMIEDYLDEGKNLRAVFFLLDIRHPPTADDVTMINYLHQTTTPFVILATKADKLSGAQVGRYKKELADRLRVGSADIIAVSSVTKEGRDKVLERIESILSYVPPIEDEDEEDDGPKED